MRRLIENTNVVAYVFFGIATTAVNIVSYWGLTRFFGIVSWPAYMISWFLAVLFAYLTNRKWVFRSYAVTLSEKILECGRFFFCRLSTGIADWLIMFVFVDCVELSSNGTFWMDNYDVFVKVFANAFVIIANFVVSRFYVFGTGKD